MTLTTDQPGGFETLQFQMPVRSMTLTTGYVFLSTKYEFQMPVRSMTLTTVARQAITSADVSDACQINDFDH